MNMLSMYTYLNKDKYCDYNHSTVQTVGQLLFDYDLYICSIAVFIVDFYCNYYCICIYIYISLICLKRGLDFENKLCLCHYHCHAQCK